MGAFSYAWKIVRRGFWHGLTAEGLAHFLSKIGWVPGAEVAFEAHFLFFVMLVIAGTLLLQLHLDSTRPELPPPCSEETPMLPLDDEK